jgi:Fic family protein
MEEKEFTEKRSGIILAIPHGIAFLPNPLPPEIHFNGELVKTLGRARGALGEFVGAARSFPNPKWIIAPLGMREAVLSNRIEGTHTAISDVLLQKAGAPPDDPEQASKHAEVLNSFRAVELGSNQIAAGHSLTKFLVRAVHAVMMGESHEGMQGAFRAKQVHIGIKYDDLNESFRSARYVPPPGEQVEPTMDNLFEIIASGPIYDPLIDCAILHYQFEAIHPFEDGNGRMGRLLIPLYLVSKQVIDNPYLYISPYFETRVATYLDLMKLVSTHGEWERWITFFLQAVESQANESKERIGRALAIYREYREKVTEKTSTQAPLAAIDLIMENVYVTAKDVSKRCSCTISTATKAIRQLATLGILAEVTNRYPRTWYAKELLEKVYE